MRTYNYYLVELLNHTMHVVGSSPTKGEYLLSNLRAFTYSKDFRFTHTVYFYHRYKQTYFVILLCIVYRGRYQHQHWGDRSRQAMITLSQLIWPVKAIIFLLPSVAAVSAEEMSNFFKENISKQATSAIEYLFNDLRLRFVWGHVFMTIFFVTKLKINKNK